MAMMEPNLIESILRANQLHEGECPWFQTRQAQRFTTMHLVVPDCTCWLSKPHIGSPADQPDDADNRQT